MTIFTPTAGTFNTKMIDTLILSGGGPSGVAYAGILKALTDYDSHIQN